MEIWSGLVVAIPTFRRNAELAAALASIGRQSVRPELVLVLDNSPDGMARAVAELSPVPAEYVALGRNTGPAGSFASAIALAKGRFEWLMCRDDDGPLPRGNEIEIMRLFSRLVSHLRPAGIGNTGERFVPSMGRSRRMTVDELKSAEWLEVDGLTGAGSPTCHLETVGDDNFDPSLFFGFEELDFGMRLRASGRRLLLNTRQTLAIREAAGTLHLGPFDFVPGRRMSAWRSYYSHRNRLIVARRYGRIGGALRLGLRSCAKVALELARGAPDRALASAIGAWDGVRGAGRTSYVPQ